MFGITNYQINANQNHSEVSLHTARVTVIKKSTNSKCYRERGEKGTPYTVGGNVKLVQPLGRTV